MKYLQTGSGPILGGSKGLGTSPFTVCTKPVFMYTVSDGQAGDGVRPRSPKSQAKKFIYFSKIPLNSATRVPKIS